MARFFVIGNGPSLNKTPLDKLIGENCIGMNRIHLIYDKVEWRPTMYLKVDFNPYLLDSWKETVLTHLNMGIPCYLWDAMRDGHPEGHPNHDILPDGVGDFENAIWVPRCEHHYYSIDNKSKAPKTWHLPEICTAGSSISAAVQIAVLNGADEIYLVGCDLGYQEQDHFVPDYIPERGRRAEITDESDKFVVLTHKLIKRSCPVPIYNATVGGYLEEYPRVDIHAL